LLCGELFPNVNYIGIAHETQLLGYLRVIPPALYGCVQICRRLGLPGSSSALVRLAGHLGALRRLLAGHQGDLALALVAWAAIAAEVATVMDCAGVRLPSPRGHPPPS
jgi:hypothetical protein